MSEEDERRSLVIFGRDIAQIPCYRSSVLYGLSAGVGGGLLCFMMTSRPKLASRVGLASLTAVTLGYWIRCRYEYSQTRFLHRQLEAAARRRIMLEGTEDGRNLDFKDA